MNKSEAKRNYRLARGLGALGIFTGLITVYGLDVGSISAKFGMAAMVFGTIAIITSIPMDEAVNNVNSASSILRNSSIINSTPEFILPWISGMLIAAGLSKMGGSFHGSFDMLIGFGVLVGLIGWTYNVWREVEIE